MSDVSGVGSSGNIPSQGDIMETATPDESTAIDFFNDQYTDQMTAIAKQQSMQGSDEW